MLDSDCTMYLSGGGRLTGHATIRSGAYVSAYSGSILDFDLTQTSAGAAALVNGLSIIRGIPLYTLTVDGMQVSGVYRLADGAAGFNKTISVVNASGVSLGSLPVGQKTTLNGVDYTLNLNNGSLSVTVVSNYTEPGPVDLKNLTFFPGDFAATGKATLALKSENRIGVCRNKGIAWNGPTLEDGWAVAGVGDFNGDGTDDIAWRNASTGLAGCWQIRDKQLAGWQNIADIA